MQFKVKTQFIIEVTADRPFKENETLKSVRKIGLLETDTKLKKMLNETHDIKLVSPPIYTSFEYIE